MDTARYNRLRTRLNMGYLVVLVALAGHSLYLPGLALVATGESLRTWAAGVLRKGEALATAGPYRFTRNPLYIGSWCSGIGLTLFSGNHLMLVAMLIAFGLLYHGMIRREERALILCYGRVYRDYLERVPRYLLPLSTLPALEAQGRFAWSTVFANGEHRTWLGLVVFVALLLARHFALPQ